MIPPRYLSCRSFTEKYFFQKQLTKGATQNIRETENYEPAIDTTSKEKVSLDQTVKNIIDYAGTHGLEVFYAARQSSYSHGSYGNGSRAVSTLNGIRPASQDK
jgi:hypothetical protein